MDLIHVCLNVADASESVDWYEEQFDFEETWAFETSDGDTVNRYVSGPGGVELQISDTKGEEPTEHGDGFDHLAIGVENVDEALEQIDHHGIVQPPKDQPAAGARTAFVEDPDGYVIELVESLDGE